MPSPGTRSWHAPGGPGIRVDAVCSYGRAALLRLDDREGHRARRSRDQAIARMRIALSEMVVEGIKTNTPLQFVPGTSI